VSWLEVSLIVNGELAEAVVDVLARFAPNGVMTEQAVKFTNPEDEGTPSGSITVRAYLPADKKLDETRHKLEEALFYLGMIQALPAPVFTRIPDQNWMEAWRVHYQPIPIGKRLIIVPSWLESPDLKRIPIRIDPGMAFGTGTHPTTQLCLELLETYTIKDDDVIDIGCGSGILLIGALKLGAHFALGVDIDEASIQATCENARVNSISQEQLAVGLGSVVEILGGSLQVSSLGTRYPRQAPLVLANILAPVIIHLFGQGLSDLVSPGGTLILSGILEEQSASVLSVGQARGLIFVDERKMGDWVALVLKHPDI
jgi:ribosomal protein L11 methyltransferase